MIYTELSKKQKIVLTWWNNEKLKHYDAIVCDGAVRSGKTIAMTDGFLLWSMTEFSGYNFGICGKTIESLRRNVVTPLHQWVEGIFHVRENTSKNYIDVAIGSRSNRYYLFGGKDESSYMLVQGITLAGVLFDEVALMPRSFVEQALARCSVKGSRFWFNCNPDTPHHWFYKEWVLDKENKKKRLHLHFMMDDNLSLAPEIKERYERDYSGVFYDRYVKGIWCAADGAIYPMFDKKKHVVPTVARRYVEYRVSVDYGMYNPFSAGLWGFYNGVWYRVREFYYDGRAKRRQKTDEEYYNDIVKLIDGLPVREIIVDPSAASFIECIRSHGEYLAIKANNAVLDGIRLTGTCIDKGKILFNDCCENTFDEFPSYVWDTKRSEVLGEDVPLKANDHAMDEIRYFCMRALPHITTRVYQNVGGI